MQNVVIKYLYLGNNPFGAVGAEAVSQLILKSGSLVELDLFNCQIEEQGAIRIGQVLKLNFSTQKVSVGANQISEDTLGVISSSVVFNTNYNEIKHGHAKYVGFAHNLIAEALKKWANTDKFIASKLEERLKSPVDELDSQVAAVIFDKRGRIELKAVPQHHEYISGDGAIRYPNKNLPRGWK